MKNEQPDGWTYCPECGCEAFEKGIWREGNEEHICTDCSQSWFADIDYSDIVHGNLRRMAVAARTTKRESGNFGTLLAEAQQIVKRHLEVMHKDDVIKRKGWVTPYGFSNFKEPVTYEEACETMKTITESFAWPKSKEIEGEKS